MISQDKSSDLRVTGKRPDLQQPAVAAKSRQVRSDIVKTLFLVPLSMQKRALLIMAVSLVLLSLTQTSLLLLVGPLLKSLFELGSSDRSIVLSSLLPEGVAAYLPSFASSDAMVVSAQRLSVVMPLLILVVGFVKALSTYGFQLNQQHISLQIARNYRVQLFSSLLQQPYESIVKRSAGSWMSLIMHDVMYLQARFSNLMGGLIKESVVVVSSFAVLFAVHWQTALTLIALSPFLIFALGRSGKRISGFSAGWQKELGVMSSHLLSIRERFPFIRAQGGEGFEKKVFNRINQRYLRLIKRSLPIRASMAPMSEFAGFVLFAVILVAINKGSLVISSGAADGLSQQGRATGTGGLELIQFFAALGLLIKPLRNIGEQVASFQETRGALSVSIALFKQLGEGGAAQIPSSSNFGQVKNFSWPLQIKRIDVGYGANKLFEVEELSFTPGQSLAVVGPSGSGKSSLIKTLSGLIQPLHWQADISWQELSEQSSLVSQKAFLFDDTLRSNLIYGSSLENSDQDLWQALDRIKLKDHFLGHDEGLEAKVNALQGSFSGGQLQRLMIARALLRPYKLLLLDEATSALDVATEEEITRFLISYSKTEQKALVFITHRLRWLHLFDLVLFIDADHSVKMGTHSELLKYDRYCEFVSSGI